MRQSVCGLFAAVAIMAFASGALHAESLGGMVESFGDSIGQGLENLGQQLNRANSSFLNSTGGNDSPASYEAQMRAYRQREAARVKEMAAVTGVSPDYIRQLRQDGATWEQIANQYGVNLNSLPTPEVTPQNPGAAD